ncbi:maltose/moltooligosaccharide transporter [Paucibacter oligotrophus]|uniref:Maltose/moltooligosaccharide transporter n=1 Tax=Roseateles oligotrophus TaxID=1769250 RepID=A0A840L4T3_9BURK|nr:MFS transporter [Roseateles oligotrophus]MBB4841833.1 maltose/moltooligosaccharide transporter [Roseateles oligotrophus]
MNASKPRLSFWQIVNMNVGFFGIQFSFGLQQSNMSPIYQYLGADEASLPLLWLAGPLTGLLVQPLIGAMSDRTVSRWGRRTPYFLIGALLCSLGLFLMPSSPTLWFAAGLLWILDAANNVTMEPYRAYVSDRLDEAQHAQGFLTQSAFTGLAQTLAYLTPSIMVWLGMDRDALNASHIPQVTVVAFMVGALLSFSTVAWSVFKVPELPLSVEEKALLTAKPRGLKATLGEIAEAFREMPPTMRQLWWMKLFQWYGMMCYWIYIVPALAHSVFATSEAGSAGFREASLLNGQIGGFYNFVAFFAAFAMLPFTRRFGAQKVHALCLTLAGIGMWAIPEIGKPWLLFVPMLGVGLAWASIMGNPYVLLAGSIPPERAGVYMGIFNIFIVIPMLIQMLTLPMFYKAWLGGQPGNVIRLAGALLVLAALAVLRVKTPAANTK